MKTILIPIGNSRGVRIPKPLIEQCGLTDEVEMEVRDGVLMIRSLNRPRAGWSDVFVRMAQNGDDKLLEPTVGTTRWETEEWQWK